MCVQQGYVPSTCTMDGQYCWMLVNSQGDPCKGCNENRNICLGKTYVDDSYLIGHRTGGLTSVAEIKRTAENSRRHDELIKQRKEGHINGFTRTTLQVECDRHEIEVIVKDIVDEKAYTAKCRDISQMLSIVSLCCKKYEVEQIHVDTMGPGMLIYNSLVEHIKNIDIVPLRYVAMKF